MGYCSLYIYTHTQDGRLQMGDQIVEINGERVAHLSHSDMVDQLFQTPPERMLALTILDISLI